MRVGILGATGFVGESLARLWAAEGQDDLTLFSRRPETLRGYPEAVGLRSVDDFDAAAFDLIISGIGAGDPAQVKALGDTLLDVTRQWDDRVLDHMRADARYVFLSSGVVYMPPPHPPYTQCKIDAEARHRSLARRSILDLRIFGYAATNIDVQGGYFLAELARSAISGVPFRTDRSDMSRDYTGGPELKAIIDTWLAAGAPNSALNSSTLKPVTKLEILDMAQKEFGVTVDWIDQVQSAPTGNKPGYISPDRASEALGYRPQRSALDVVRAMLKAVMAGRQA